MEGRRDKEGETRRQDKCLPNSANAPLCRETPSFPPPPSDPDGIVGAVRDQQIVQQTFLHISA